MLCCAELIDKVTNSCFKWCGRKVLLSRASLRKFLLLSTSSKYMTCFLSSSATQAKFSSTFHFFQALEETCLSFCGSRCVFLEATGDMQYNIPVASVMSHLTGFLILLSTQVKMQIVTRAGITFCADFILSKLKLHAKSVENPGLC